LRGTLSVRWRACGKPNCRCARGQRHATLYLVQSRHGQLRQLSIPRRWENRVREAVSNYHEIQRLLEEFSERERQRLREGKRRQEAFLAAAADRLCGEGFRSGRLHCGQGVGRTAGAAHPHRCSRPGHLGDVLGPAWQFERSGEPLRARFWRQWLGQPLCSADTIGRVYALLSCEQLRAGLHYVYHDLKRNKALLLNLGRDVAVWDGHDSHASYGRHCAGCLQRVVPSEEGERIQYYHRHVTLMLLPGALRGHAPLRLLLDAEPQRPSEDEATAALRLLARVLARYPRAFKLVLADGLYASARFFHFLLDHGKHAQVVFKDERRNHYQDVQGRWARVPPRAGRYRQRACLWWDLDHLVSWPEVKVRLRVTRSRESYWLCHPRTRHRVEQTSDWIWVTTLPAAQLSTWRAVALGHQRWDIENHRFNELANEWLADHVYKHDPAAMEAFLRTALLAFNLYHAFIRLNLKPPLWVGKPQSFWARLIATALYAEAGRVLFGLPP
jgi:hypothetical protein